MVLTKIRVAAARSVREFQVSRRIARRGAGRPILFFPSYWRAHSSLLRVDHVAEVLAGRGWSPAFVHPSLTVRQRRRLIARMKPEILFIHLARNETHDPAFYPGGRIVFDFDDADFLNPRFAERTKACVKGADGVIAGSRFLRDWAASEGAARSAVVWTGARPSDGPRPAQRDRATIVTWAQSDPFNYPEEFAFIENVMTGLARRRGGVRLRMYGWRDRYDQARLAPMEAAGVQIERLAPMPYGAFLESLRDVAVGLSPVIEANEYSRGKSFGKIIAYFDAHVPVVTTDAVDHPLLFDGANGVLDDDPAFWIDQIDALLDDPARRQAIADAGFATYRRRLTAEAAAQQVEAFLNRVVAGS